MSRLLGAAGAFMSFVMAGLLLGAAADKATGGGWWALIGLGIGVAVGVAGVYASVRPLLK